MKKMPKYVIIISEYSITLKSQEITREVPNVPTPDTAPLATYQNLQCSTFIKKRKKADPQSLTQKIDANIVRCENKGQAQFGIN